MTLLGDSVGEQLRRVPLSPLPDRRAEDPRLAGSFGNGHPGGEQPLDSLHVHRWSCHETRNYQTNVPLGGAGYRSSSPVALIRERV